uniref:Lysosome-associated membrane glycoprotein 5 n=1 Tax=Eptatretus burgeri TaxID=7764 RepID=A0A8C4N9I8_EPTBU
MVGRGGLWSPKDLICCILLTYGARTYCTVRAPAVAVASGASAGEDAGISLEDNGTTCLMAKFAIKFLIPYDVWASNFVDLVTEEATIAMPKNVKIRGNCAESNTSQKPELVLSWHEESYVLNFQFDTEDSQDKKQKQQKFWKITKISFTYDTSDTTHFKEAINAGMFTASTGAHAVLFRAPLGYSYSCTTQGNSSPSSLMTTISWLNSSCQRACCSLTLRVKTPILVQNGSAPWINKKI